MSSPFVVALLVFVLAWLAAGHTLELVYGPEPRRGTLRRDLLALQGVAVLRGRSGAHPGRRWLAPPPGFHAPVRYWLSLAVIGSGLLLIGVTLFRSFVIGLVLLPLLLLYRLYLLRQHQRRRHQLLAVQFREALNSIANSLRAGASLHTALERCVSDLRRLLTGQSETPVIDEMERVVRDLQLGAPLEEALTNLRNRAGLEDVTDFVNATLLTKVRGGNLPMVMTAIAQVIGDKITVREQVHVLTAGKRIESLVLSLAPPGMVALMAVSSPNYLAPMFTTLIGRVLMGVGLAMLIAAYLIGRKIVDIDV